MTNTGFTVPAAKLDRLTACYTAGEGGLVLLDPGPGGPWSRPPIFPSEAVSTARDYLAFARMLLDRRDDPRLAPMLTDQITPEQKANSPFYPGFWETQGWGMGLSISRTGRFAWSGGLGTTFFVDPRQDLVAVLLTQREQDGEVGGLYADFFKLAGS